MVAPMRPCVLSAIAAALISALAAPAAIADPVTAPVETWVPDGEVKAVAVSGSTAYIGGNFSRIAPYTGSSALFNATNGELEKPWPEVNGVVNDVIPDGIGGWYLGGDFKTVGGLQRIDLAHVLAGGSVDLNFAPSTNGEVRALAFDGATLFAGGEFSQANAASRGNLAGFNPATGALTAFTARVAGNGPQTLFDPLGVHALLLKGTKLYVGGEFNQAGPAEPLTEVRLRGAAFDTTSSALDASWQPNPNRLINGLALDSDGTDVFIGGRFSEVDGPTLTANAPRNGVAKVNESAGTADANWVAPLQLSDMTTLMVFGSQVYVAGSVRVSPSETWPVASLSTANNNAGLNINWHPVPPGTVQSLAASGGRVYIGSGTFSSADGPQPAIIGVDATSFPSTGTPDFAPALGRGRQSLPSGQQTGVRAIGANGADVVAGGTFINVGGVDRRNLGAIDLNTGQATAFNPPMKGMFSPLTFVNSIAVTSDGVVWAGGLFQTEGPNERVSLAAFEPATGNLTTFHRDPSGGGGLGSQVSALVAAGDTVYVGGGFAQIGGIARRNVAAVRHVPGDIGAVLDFDGDVDGPVNALALSSGTLYAGGQFTSVNGGIASLRRERRNLVALDATTGLDRGWDPDADAAVHALAIDGDTIYAGGDFANVNKGVPRQRLAAFDTQAGGARAWNPGADATVRSLATYGPTIFAGGDFANAGGVPRAGIADFDAQSGAPDTFSLTLDTEERGNLSSAGTRVNALSASPTTGLVTGGTFVMNSPTPRTANLNVFGLAPLPAGGTTGGQAPGGGDAGGVTPGDGTDPVLGLAASRRRFRAARGATRADGKATPARNARRRRRTPAGTTLTLRLSEAARVKFEVLVKTRGRRVGKRCVKQTRRNRSRRPCTRLVVKKPAFTRSAPLGRSRVKWTGRLGRKALKSGSYVLRATPTDAAGNTGKARQISFRIVRR
jgi:hypothetical protein